MNEEQDNWIVRAMSEPSFYDHPAAEVQLVETHISWVFLAGDFVYKVKKPLELGFLDFATLAKRHHFCDEELRLNRNFAPNLYLAVIPIGGSALKPQINQEPALEYAVKMRRFPQECQLDRMLASGRLQPHHIIAFAAEIAALHRAAEPVAALTPYGSPDAVIDPVLENFRQIRPLIGDAGIAMQLDRLEEWGRASVACLRDVIIQRKADGFVRACHGDIHLANMAWVDQRPLLFDCIEFNDNLRWIDVANDIAFLVMDLDDRELPELGWLFLNHYLQDTGDYRGLLLLNFYKAYRAMVRAKVACLRLSQGHLVDAGRSQIERLFHSYLDLSERYASTNPVPLVITHGLSGAGKSTLSAQLACCYGAIHLRSDIERKRLFGLSAAARTDSPVDGGIYSQQAFSETYQRLHELAGVVLRAGLPVIVDATFIKRHQRELFSRLAAEMKVPFIVLDFAVPEAELRQRIEHRASGVPGEASEATIEVLEFQLEHREPLTDGEARNVIRVEIGAPVEVLSEMITKRIQGEVKP